jgi:hypothetical protein
MERRLLIVSGYHSISMVMFSAIPRPRENGVAHAYASTQLEFEREPISVFPRDNPAGLPSRQRNKCSRLHGLSAPKRVQTKLTAVCGAQVAAGTRGKGCASGPGRLPHADCNARLGGLKLEPFGTFA